MFDKGVLGEDSPLQLLQTKIYMVGLHCALQVGIEHSKLCRPGFNCQITIEFDYHGKRRLVYCKDPLSKTNQGGLNGKTNAKVVYVYEASDFRRCPIRLFKKYISLLPPAKSCKKLYLRP